MVIDFHVHMFPDAMAQKTINSLAQRSGLAPNSDGTADVTAQKMKQAGVDKAAVQNIATNPRQMHKVNDFAIATNKKEEFIAFGSVHPEAEDYIEELDRICEAGLLGIKLHPDYQDFFIDSSKMQPIYEAALRRGLIILFHTGIDIGLPEPVHATPKAIANTLGLFSGEKVVFAHMGGFGMNDEALEYVIGQDVYIDTSCMADYGEQQKWEEMLTAHKPDKILFATDFPWGNFSHEIEAINNLNIPKELKENIFYKNAKTLLQL